MSILEILRTAFSSRERPNKTFQNNFLSDDEKNAVSSFKNKSWNDLTGSFLDRNHDALYWFCPEQFCFYLPRILYASVLENNPNLIANHIVIGMLDRTPDVSLWDDFFIARWTLLKEEECNAVQAWLLWLLEHPECGIDDISIERAFDTVELIKNK